MIGVLIIVGLLGYATMYSGLSELGSVPGGPVSIYEALTGKAQKGAAKAPSTASPVAGSGGGGTTKKM